MSAACDIRECTYAIKSDIRGRKTEYKKKYIIIVDLLLLLVLLLLLLL